MYLGFSQRGEVAEPIRLMDIRVYNLIEDTWTGKSDDVCRPGVLGNPFVIGKDGFRPEVLEKYKTYLWAIIKEGMRNADWKIPKPDVAIAILTRDAESCLRKGDLKSPVLGEAVWRALMKLLERGMAGERLQLLCFCKPQDCHGDIIRNCLEWMASKPPGRPVEPKDESVPSVAPGQGELL